MNGKYYKGYFFVIFLALSILAIVSCNQSSNSKQIPVAEGLIDGGSTGRKTSESLYQIRTIATIGIEEAQNEEEKPYQIASIRNIDCDAEGNLYLVESKTHCVKVFDQNGKFLRKMFRMGRGPNEIYRPAFCKINKFSNTLFQTIDYGYHMKQFDFGGEFLRSIHLPEPILMSYDFISKNQLIYVSDCHYGENTYYNFKVLNVDKNKIVFSFAAFMFSERSDSFNSFQRFAIKDGLLWTSPIHDIHLIAFDLSNGKRVKKLTVTDEVKKNRVISYTHKGLKYVPVVSYNYAQPLLLNGKLFVIWTEKDYNFKKNTNPHHAINYPESWKLSLYRLVNDAKLEKVVDLKECDYMRMEATYKNRIILSGWEPYWHVKIIEMKPK